MKNTANNDSPGPDFDFGPDAAHAAERIACLAGFMTPERYAVLRKTVSMRTRYMTVLAENMYHGQNAAALIRHCEAFGVQEMHTVETLCPFEPNPDIARGTHQWVDVRRHASTGEAVAAKYYQQRGWLLLNHNYRTRLGELDLILYKENTLVFAEVKTRTGAMLDRPAAAVSAKALASGCPERIGPRLRLFILIVGVVSLLFVPVFKSLTGLPPYMGMMVSLGFMWILTEIIYDRKRSIRNMEESIQPRVSKVLKHIDMPTILFFLGILMAVGALQTGGVLTDMADWLDKNVHEVFTIAGAIGILSSVVDNVPLVAACMGMYPVADVATAAASADPAFAQSFVADGLFWHLLTYCAGVGGSLLIIGSAAGVVAMGLEKINFGWYLKRISLLALSGYLAGIAVIWLEHVLIGL